MDADNGEEMPADMDADKGEEDMEDRVVDLEDALDELKAEFEAMMGKKDDAEDKDESEVAPELTPEVEMESKEATKETVKEYKIQKSADNADHADNKKSTVAVKGGSEPKADASNIAKGGAEEKGRPAPTAQKMSDFENTGGKDKSTSFKKQGKADTADHSDKSAKSPITGK